MAPSSVTAAVKAAARATRMRCVRAHTKMRARQVCLPFAQSAQTLRMHARVRAYLLEQTQRTLEPATGQLTPVATPTRGRETERQRTPGTVRQEQEAAARAAERARADVYDGPQMADNDSGSPRTTTATTPSMRSTKTAMVYANALAQGMHSSRRESK